MKNEPCSVQVMSSISHRHFNAKQRSSGTSLSPRYAKIATAQDKSFSVETELNRLVRFPASRTPLFIAKRASKKGYPLLSHAMYPSQLPLTVLELIRTNNNERSYMSYFIHAADRSCTKLAYYIYESFMYLCKLCMQQLYGSIYDKIINKLELLVWDGRFGFGVRPVRYAYDVRM